jgi:cell division protein FtsL
MIDWADGIETRNYGIKSEIDAHMLSELVRTMAFLALVAGALLFYSWVRSQLVETGYKTQKLFNTEETLLRTERKLILEEETLRDPERIDLIARNDLGMTPLRPNQLIIPQFRDLERSAFNAVAMVTSEATDSKKPAYRQLGNFSD